MNTFVNLWCYLAELVFKCKVFQTRVVEKIKTHILCSINIFFSENGVGYEIKWEIRVEPDRPQMTVKYGTEKMRFSYGTNKARKHTHTHTLTHTHIISNTYCFSMNSPIVKAYVYCPSCVCVYIYIYVCVCVCVYMYTYICVYMYICI